MDRLADKLEQGKLYLRRPIHQVLPPSLLLHLVPPLPPLRYILVGLAALLLLLLRVWLILPGTSHRRAAQKPTTHRSYTVAAFLGSGGHTTELLQLVSALPTQRYARRIYLVSSGDRFSWKKANDLERTLSADRTSSAHVLQIPRARNVHQSFVTTPWTLAKSIAFCLHHVALRPLTRPCNKSNRVLADVILMNGPGTCVPIVIAVYLLRVSCPFHPLSSLAFEMHSDASYRIATGPCSTFTQAHLRRVLRSSQIALVHRKVDPTLCRSFRAPVATTRFRPHTSRQSKSNAKHSLLWLARLKCIFHRHNFHPESAFALHTCAQQIELYGAGLEAAPPH